MSESAESPMALYTIVHGFEAATRKPTETVGKRRRAAVQSLAAAPPRMQPGKETRVVQPAPVRADSDDDGAGKESSRPISATAAVPSVARGKAVYSAKGYGAQAFNESVALDSSYVTQLLSTVAAPPDDGLYQSRVVRPSGWVWLM